MKNECGYIKVMSRCLAFPEGTKVIDKDALIDLLKEHNYAIEHLYTDVSEVCIPSTVLLIADWAFSKCVRLESVIVPKNNTLQYIGQGAFKGCTGLEHFDFGFCTSLRLIDDFAFINTRIGENQLKDIPTPIYNF